MAKKTKEIKTVQCITCKKAVLMQRGNNPVIADCSYTGYKEVAASYRLCYGYEKDTKEKPIKKWN